MAMMVTTPFMSFATEEAVVDVPENGRATVSEAADLSDMTEEKAVTDELLVIVEKGTTKREVSKMTDDAGASLDSVTSLGDGTRMAKISLDDPADAEDVAGSLVEEDEVIVVQPNYKYKIEDDEIDAPITDSEPKSEEESVNADENNPGMILEESIDANQQGTDYTDQQWHLQSSNPGSLNIPSSWSAIPQDINKVKVAVIDTGVDYNHPDLSETVIVDECVSFENSDGTPQDFKYKDGKNDDEGHGTHVCGIIAANASDDEGVTGAAYNRVKLIVIDAHQCVKRYDGSGGEKKYFSTSDLVYAINYAVSMKARVINMSLGGYFKDAALSNAVKSAWDKGVVCICAAGNDNTSQFMTPGDSPYAISVMSHDNRGIKSSFSDYGSEKDVSAPGSGIYSTLPSVYNDSTNQYEPSFDVKSGTSMATPMVTALAALLLSENEYLTPRQLKNYIYTSSNSQKYDGQGFGKVNFTNARSNLDNTAEPQKVLLNRNSVQIDAGDTVSIEYAVYPGSASEYASETTFLSGDSSVASVDQNGVVTGTSEGSTTITVNCRGAKAYCEVVVSNAEPASAPHVHTWTSFVAKEPTEDAEGSMGHRCTGCGDTYYTSIARIVYPTDLPSVKISKPAAAKGKMTVKWKKVSKKNKKKIGGIEIQVSGPGYYQTFTAGKGKASKRISGLARKQKYSVRIRAYNYIGGIKHVSTWSKWKTAKTK